MTFSQLLTALAVFWLVLAIFVSILALVAAHKNRKKNQFDADNEKSNK